MIINRIVYLVNKIEVSITRKIDWLRHQRFDELRVEIRSDELGVDESISTIENLNNRSGKHDTIHGLKPSSMKSSEREANFEIKDEK